MKVRPAVFFLISSPRQGSIPADSTKPESADSLFPVKQIWKSLDMEFADFLAPDAIISMLKVESKKQAIQEMATKASELTGLPEREIFDILLQRERFGSTAVGGGVAIPHGKLDQFDKLFGLFARLEKPIEFDSLDDQPVDLVFMLLTPENASAEHLKALSLISSLFRNQEASQKLRSASNNDEIYEIITETPDSENDSIRS